MKADETFLRRMHRILFEFDIVKGKLVCEDCGRVYPIVDGIPNLIMDDEEI
jgi:multifunctional methyltransferase subunit TRM112